SLGDGGVWINAGSSVILPEVFLKALSLSRNLGHDVRDFTTVDLDMIRHYRPAENVLKRPILAGGRSYALPGHHEPLVPLLSLASMSRRAGGAGNVVENLAALGARTIALGAVGPEEEGAWLARRLSTLPGARPGFIAVDPARTTPVKRRMVSEGRQL